mgnify:CR=1 FL=1
MGTPMSLNLNTELSSVWVLKIKKINIGNGITDQKGSYKLEHL